MSLSENQNGHSFNIAIVGGGSRCLSFLKLLEYRTFKRLKVNIVGVADIRPQAAGIQYARKKKIFTTTRFTDLFGLAGLDLIINFTGDVAVSHELSFTTPDHLPVLNHMASRLLQEIVQDVFSSTRKIARQEEALSLNSSFIQALAEVTVVGAMVMDLGYKVVWINDAALNRIGVKKEEVLGRYCFQVSHNAITPCDSPDLPCPMKETLRTGKSAHAIHEHIYHDQARYCDVTTFPILNSKQEVVQVLEVVRDITEEMNDRLEHRTRAIKDDLARLVQEDKMISLGKMVASVAHEINNPIGSIINFNKLILTTLQDGPPSQKTLDTFQRYLKMTIREAQRCGTIVNNLLSFSRQQQIESGPIDLNEIFQRIVMLTQHRMALSDIELELDMSEKPLEITGDYTQIQQCFTNFVFNAMEAMPQGGTLSIAAGTGRVEGHVWVDIRDTGIGIPRRIWIRYLNPFSPPRLK